MILASQKHNAVETNYETKIKLKFQIKKYIYYKNNNNSSKNNKTAIVISISNFHIYQCAHRVSRSLRCYDTYRNQRDNYYYELIDWFLYDLQECKIHETPRIL